MSDVSEKIARQDRILAELSELAIGVARDLAGQVSAAESAQDAAAVASAFHKVGRAVRQTIALEMRLQRDRKALDREDGAHAAGAREASVKQRRERLRTVVHRMVWAEGEKDEAEALDDQLDQLLAEDVLDEAFADNPFEDQVARLRFDLGLPPEPPDEDDDKDGAPAKHPPDVGAGGVPPPPSGRYGEQPPCAAEIRAQSG
jgi:hypothetical protein